MIDFFIPALVTLILLYLYLRLLLAFKVEYLKLIHIIPIFFFFIPHYLVYTDFSLMLVFEFLKDLRFDVDKYVSLFFKQ